MKKLRLKKITHLVLRGKGSQANVSWQQRVQPSLQFEPQKNHALSTQTQGLKFQHCGQAPNQSRDDQQRKGM
jgi:hypothetical protein